MTSPLSRRAGGVQGPQRAATGPEPSSGVGPAFHLDEPEPALRSYLELGALPTAVPRARLHARHVLWEWGLNGVAPDSELLVSELVTNAVKATAGRDHAAVRCGCRATAPESSSRSGTPTRGRQHRKTSANTEHPTLRKREDAGCSSWRR
jgi:hypothetical protein